MFAVVLYLLILPKNVWTEAERDRKDEGHHQSLPQRSFNLHQSRIVTGGQFTLLFVPVYLLLIFLSGIGIIQHQEHNDILVFYDAYQRKPVDREITRHFITKCYLLIRNLFYISIKLKNLHWNSIRSSLKKCFLDLIANF